MFSKGPLVSKQQLAQPMNEAQAQAQAPPQQPPSAPGAAPTRRRSLRLTPKKDLSDDMNR